MDPTDATHLVVCATFGLLESFDAGARWSWICERAVASEGFLDPEIIVLAGGRTAVALQDGLAIGDRTGCQWTRAPGLVGDDVIDLAGSRPTSAIAYAVSAIRVGGVYNTVVSRSTDGTAWTAVGDTLANTYPLTIEVAPSRPERLYLGAQDANLEKGFIDVSDDAGAHWISRASPDADAVFVSAVDPSDPDRVYVRSFSPAHNLYVSEDGAATWRSIYGSLMPLAALALSPDGRQVAVGGAAGLTMLARSDGDGGSDFSVTPISGPPVTCLTWTAGGLFACADERSAGFTVGASADNGKTFTSLLRLVDIVPAACPAASAGAVCAAEWCATAASIGGSCAATIDAAADHPADPGDGHPTARSGCACQVGAGRDAGALPEPRWIELAPLLYFLSVFNLPRSAARSRGCCRRRRRC